MRRRSDIVGSGLVTVADNDETLQRSNRRVINQLRLQLTLQTTSIIGCNVNSRGLCEGFCQWRDHRGAKLEVS